MHAKQEVGSSSFTVNVVEVVGLLSFELQLMEPVILQPLGEVDV